MLNEQSKMKTCQRRQTEIFIFYSAKTWRISFIKPHVWNEYDKPIIQNNLKKVLKEF